MYVHDVNNIKKSVSNNVKHVKTFTHNVFFLIKIASEYSSKLFIALSEKAAPFSS